jgi:hypothetical protein
MKKTLLMLFVCCTLLSHAANPIKYKLAENQKMEKTYTFDLKEAGSLHVIIAKNKDSKKYDLIPLLATGADAYKTLQVISFEELPNILSFHKNGSVITLADFNNKTLNVTQFDLQTLTGTTKAVTGIEEPANVLRQEDRTIFISKKKGEFVINEISGTGSIKEVKVAKGDDKKYKDFFSNDFEAVNTGEFVANGSISEYKCYARASNIIFTVDDTKTASVKTMTVDITTGKTAYATHANNFEDAKNVTSYVANDKLFAVATNKDELQLNAFNIADGQPVGSFGFADIKAAVGKSPGLQSYLAMANNSAMKPTVTVNKAKDKFAVRFDAVNRSMYTYQDNFWMMRMMQMQMQQLLIQQQMQNLQRLQRGPSAGAYDEIADVYNALVAKDMSFTVLLDADMKMSTGAGAETDFKQIDQKKMTKPFEESKTLENFSAVFMEDGMHYICQSKKTKEITIDVKKYGIKQ